MSKEEKILNLILWKYVYFVKFDDTIWILKKINRHKEIKTILDLGCGEGITTICMAKLFPKAKVFGIDHNKNSIKDAKEFATRLKLKNVRFEVADIKKIPFKNSFFDCVISQKVFHYFKNKKEKINEITRVLKTNGIVYMAEFIKVKPELIKDKINYILNYLMNFRLRYYISLKEFLSITEEANLKPIQCDSHCGLSCKGTKVYNFIFQKGNGG